MNNEWRCEYFPSGTMLVSRRRGESNDPWLYIYGPLGANEDDTEENRYKVVQDVCDYMNGGPRPAWLDDLRRTREDYAEDLDGTRITATGPMVDIDPPNLNWRQDNSEAARNARARLMDRLFFTPKK
jgi:hypothetical protein